ncbi:Alpha-L-fucosidase [Aphelenchoides besseyi]|nr:Alpha-L-fucosidase [Aphelenchoides besseyi]
MIKKIRNSSWSYRRFTPDWTSLDNRTAPVWYDSDKFGIFVHWGVFSVIGHRSEWIWWYWKGDSPDKEVVQYMNQHYPNGTTYADFARDFTAAEFDPNEFADVIKASGARYFVLTSKHHEGFTLWPSLTTFNWNSVDVGAHRDLVGDLAKAIRAQDIHFGLYFSQMAWFHPLYLADKKDKTANYPTQISLPQMYEIVNKYQPEVLWSDGDWEQPPEYWKSQEFLAWLFNDSPVKNKILVNDRFGAGTAGKHGSFFNHADGYLPGHLLRHKWECCMVLDDYSWGYRRNLKSGDVKSTKQVLSIFVKVLAWGGNLLLNIGPNHLGRIPPIFEDRLREVGKFVNAYSEAIFETKPWIYQNDSFDVWYTSRLRSSMYFDDNRAFNPQSEENTIVYAFILNYDTTNQIDLPSIKTTEKTVITLLGTKEKAKIVSRKPTTIELPPWQLFPYREVVVLKIEYAADSNFKPKVYDS